MEAGSESPRLDREGVTAHVGAAAPSRWRSLAAAAGKESGEEEAPRLKVALDGARARLGRP